MSDNLIYAQESYAIYGAAQQVYKTMGTGFLEAVYQECMELELTLRAIPFAAQKPLELNYAGRSLKQRYQPDFVCYDKIIVELKAVARITDEHRRQVMNYLKATGFKLGLLYNFGHYPLVQQVRVVNNTQPSATSTF